MMIIDWRSHRYRGGSGRAQVGVVVPVVGVVFSVVIGLGDEVTTRAAVFARAVTGRAALFGRTRSGQAGVFARTVTGDDTER